MLDIKETLQEFSSFSYDITSTGRIRYSAPEGLHDDCFVSGTRVLTNEGQTNIQDLRVGDLVMTRKGYKPVVFTRSSIKPVINHLLGLRGTRTHPIITKKEGTKPLALACGNDIIYMWNEKLLCIEEKSIIDTQTQKEGNIRRTIGNTTNGESRLSHFIGKYGLTTLVKYLRDILSTTKTETPLIIDQKILKPYRNQNTQECILPAQRECYSRPLTLKSKVKDFIYLLSTGKINNPGRNATALNVIQALMLKLIQIKYFALNCVKIVILGKEDDYPEIVYNIQVEECPEYFANNILVHNCVIAHALALTELYDIVKTEEKEVSRIKAELEKRASGYYTEDTYEPI